MAKWWLAAAAALLLLSGCGEKKPASPSEQQTTAPAPGEKIVPFQDKLPAFPSVSDPYTSEQAAANGDVVNVHGKLTNLDRWKLFLANIDAGVPDQVRLTQYTIEGDPIFYELVYDGAEVITYTYDNSMDGFGSDLGRPSTACRAVELKTEAEFGTHYVLTGCEDSEIAQSFWFTGDAQS